MRIFRGVEVDKRLKTVEKGLLAHDLPMFVKRFDGRKAGPVVAFCALCPMLDHSDGLDRTLGVWQSLN